MSDPFYTQIIRDKPMTWTQFIGNTGGLIGLCLGFSFVSIVEIFYHSMLAVAAFCRRRKQMEQNLVWIIPEKEYF